MLKLVAAVAVLTAASAASAETYAIQAGRLIVDAAKPARGASTVIVENGRITGIEDGFTAPTGATVVDERSRTVMSGMASRSAAQGLLKGKRSERNERLLGRVNEHPFP